MTIKEKMELKVIRKAFKQARKNDEFFDLLNYLLSNNADKKKRLAYLIENEIITPAEAVEAVQMLFK